MLSGRRRECRVGVRTARSPECRMVVEAKSASVLQPMVGELMLGYRSSHPRSFPPNRSFLQVISHSEDELVFFLIMQIVKVTF